MVAFGIIAVLIVLYIIIAPKDASRECNEYHATEYTSDRHHQNRVLNQQYR